LGIFRQNQDKQKQAEKLAGSSREGDRIKAASSEFATREILASLALRKDCSPKIEEAITCNPNASSETLTLIVSRCPSNIFDIRLNIAKHRNSDSDALKKTLLNSSLQSLVINTQRELEIVEEVMKNQNVSAEVSEIAKSQRNILLKIGSEIIGIFGRPGRNKGLEEIVDLCFSGDMAKQLDATKSSKILPFLLEQLAKSQYDIVRRSVALHNNTAKDVIERLTKDPNLWIRSIAELRRSGANVQEMFKNKERFNDLLLEYMAQSREIAMRRYASSYEQTKSDVLRVLCKDEDPQTRLNWSVTLTLEVPTGTVINAHLSETLSCTIK
jgi:hypothetical protein